ncbi:heme-dependent oxidative N-demethylase family protein [Primorskyibacter sp. S87]|uniref:heme-dependent oxidative N-demethylase family protein n=1 Tax=Primorskyibacter sp. S87 TaxID=3415126 RepID=UPI003C7BF62F
MTEILQCTLPYDPFSPRPLPGIQPLDPDGWVLRDEAFAGQMARRDALIEQSRNAVIAMNETARAAAEELLASVLAVAYPETGQADVVQRPDGVEVALDRVDPIATLGRLVQEDLCILQKIGNEHVLTAGCLCFPASWALSEKFMRPLIGIHDPVDSYDANVATRVQRLFDGVRAGRPLWRFNALWYEDAELHQPRTEAARRNVPDRKEANYLRTERQCILRLPETDAVVFSIHTFVLDRKTVERAGWSKTK